MKLIKGLTGIILTNVVIVSMLLLFSCRKEGNSLKGKWINVNFDLNNYLIYDFNENDIYLISHDNIIKRKWEINKGNLQLIDLTGGIERFEILVNSTDSLIMRSGSEVFTLLPINDFELLSCDGLEKKLIRGFWKYNINDSIRFLDFLNNGKYLVSIGKNSLGIGTGDWTVVNKDSICVLLLNDITISSSFLEKISADSLKVSVWYDNQKNELTLINQEIDYQVFQDIQNNIDGRWELTETSTNPKVPDVIEFINEEGYREYYFRLPESIPKLGSWKLSKNMRTIILDDLDHGHSGYMKILHLNSSKMKLDYLGSHYTYLRTAREVLF